MEFNFSNRVQSLKPSAIREIFKSLTNPNVISFAAGNPSPLSFPVEKLKVLADKIFEESAASSLQYGITEGYTPLREQVAERLKSKFNTGRDFDETIIVSGGQQGIDGENLIGGLGNGVPQPIQYTLQKDKQEREPAQGGTLPQGEPGDRGGLV